MCLLATGTSRGGVWENLNLERVIQMLNAIKGWDFDTRQAVNTGLRVANLRHGIGNETERPSLRYDSVPVDGPCQGKNIMVRWTKMLDTYYQAMGWDRKTGKPTSQTLKGLGLENLIADIRGV